jgi:cytochrome P450
LLYELAKRPDIQDEIYSEIKNNIKFYEGNIKEDYLEKIPLLKSALKESQRMHSINPVISRVLKEDLVIDDYLIPRGVMA